MKRNILRIPTYYTMGIEGSSSLKVPVEIKCNIEAGSIAQLFLIFSIDNGSSWYEVEMHEKPPFYFVTIPNVRIGVRILYAFKAIGMDGAEFIEDNGGQYFSQVAGSENIDLVQKASPSEPLVELSASPQDSDEDEEYSGSETTDSGEIYNRFISAEPSTQEVKVEKNYEYSNGSIQAPSAGIKIPVSLGIQSPKVREIENPIVASTNNAENAPEKDIIAENGIIEQENIQIPELSQFETFSSKNEIKQDATAIVKSKTQDSAQYPAPFTNQSGNSDLARPIIPYNPYTIEDGEVTRQVTVLQSFSQIIGAKATKAPQKKQSFIKRPQVENQKRCSRCNANLNQKWRVCVICGQKL